MNLYFETSLALESNGKSFDDVKWVGVINPEYIWHTSNFESYEIVGNWKEELNIEYNNDYGIEEIDLGLVVVGDDWWLSREHYDGKEWWRFNQKPERPILKKGGEDVKNK